MNNGTKTLQKISFTSRLKSATWALLSLIAAIMLLLYGIIFTTNILTQLNHADTWFYTLVVVLCYLFITFGVVILSKVMSRHLKSAKTGFRPVSKQT